MKTVFCKLGIAAVAAVAGVSMLTANAENIPSGNPVGTGSLGRYNYRTPITVGAKFTAAMAGMPVPIRISENNPEGESLIWVRLDDAAPGNMRRCDMGVERMNPDGQLPVRCGRGPVQHGQFHLRARILLHSDHVRDV